VKEEGSYNIMKEQASQETVNSTFVLVNGNKIIKWWVAIVQMEALHDYGD
jgi:valyl-tRNA synthetase